MDIQTYLKTEAAKAFPRAEHISVRFDEENESYTILVDFTEFTFQCGSDDDCFAFESRSHKGLVLHMIIPLPDEGVIDE